MVGCRLPSKIAATNVWIKGLLAIGKCNTIHLRLLRFSYYRRSLTALIGLLRMHSAFTWRPVGTSRTLSTFGTRKEFFEQGQKLSRHTRHIRLALGTFGSTRNVIGMHRVHARMHYVSTIFCQISRAECVPTPV